MGRTRMKIWRREWDSNPPWSLPSGTYRARTALQERGSTRWFSLTDCKLIADFDRPLPCHRVALLCPIKVGTEWRSHRTSHFVG
jgi:hypothetical protein